MTRDDAAAMDGARALAFVKGHGVVLQSASGAVPSLVEAIAGEAIRGSWWGHPRGRAIYRVLEEVGGSEEILTCKLLDGRLTLVHRRLWPALVRCADRFPKGSLDRVANEHTRQGFHQSRSEPFPEWVPAGVRAAAAKLPRAEAEAILGRILPTPARRGKKT